MELSSNNLSYFHNFEALTNKYFSVFLTLCKKITFYFLLGSRFFCISCLSFTHNWAIIIAVHESFYKNIYKDVLFFKGAFYFIRLIRDSQVTILLCFIEMHYWSKFSSISCRGILFKANYFGLYHRLLVCCWVWKHISIHQNYIYRRS